MTAIDRLNGIFRRLPVAVWIVVLNVAVFVGLRLTAAILRFSGADMPIESIIGKMMLSSSPDEILRHPWTLLTYMFVQYDVLHLLINMLWLYAFAAVVVTVVGARRLWMIYIVGGLGGAIGYLAATYLFADGVGSGLVGASASAIAVMAASMVLCPNQKFNLFFFGEVTLKVLGLIFVLLLVASTGTDEYGSHLAHAGGFVAGGLLALRWKRSYAKKRSRQFRPFVVSSPTPRANKSKQAPVSDATLDQLLDKIRTSGYASLSEDERRRLFKISSNLSNCDRK